MLVRRAVVTILIVGVVIVGAGLLGRQLPAGFIPDEDQGLLGVNVQLPPGASLERTGAVLTRVEGIVAKARGVDSFATIGGFGLVIGVGDRDQAQRLREHGAHVVVADLGTIRLAPRAAAAS